MLSFTGSCDNLIIIIIMEGLNPMMFGAVTFFGAILLYSLHSLFCKIQVIQAIGSYVIFVDSCASE